MTTGNTQTMGGQPRIRRSLALLCVAALLLGLWMPWAKAAGVIEVVAVLDGGYQTTETPPRTVFPITLNSASTDWKINEVTAGGNNYHQAEKFFAPADTEVVVALTYNGSDTITADRISIADAAVTAGGTANTFTATLTGITADTPLTITVTPPTIKLTFPASDVYSVWFGGDMAITEATTPMGKDRSFELRINPALYAIPQGTTDAQLSTIITACNVTVNSEIIAGSKLMLSVDGGTVIDAYAGGSIKGIIPGVNLAADTAISFDFNTGNLTSLIGVKPVSGAGYRLVTERGAIPDQVPGEMIEQKLGATLTVDADYGNSLPAFESSNCNIVVNGPYPSYGGDVRWDIAIAHIDGSAFTAADAPIVVTVTGIEPNNPPPVDPTPPPSGGGDSGGGGGGEDNAPPAPTIRVENELNKGDIKSDTTLWPGHTTERDGVSTTTVTDAELKALLELARQHAKDIEGIPGEGLKEGIFYIEDLHTTSENATYVLELTGDQLQTLEQEGWDRLTVQTPAGSFSLYPEALAQAGAEITDGSQPVRITLHRLDYENRPGVDANLTVDKKQVTSFETPYGVRIVVPYTPAPGEDVNALIIDYIHEDGTVERVTECHYDPEAGGLVFFTTHLSKFGVAYRPAAFVDVTAKHWANPYVTFLASRGVISGYGDKKFRPDDLATRGETIAMLTKALSAVKCPKKPIQVYTDVALGSSISGASNWLYFNNLAPFLTTGTRLKPGASVAKQDVAALVNNVAAGVGLRVRSRGLDTGYTDLGELADYAKPAVIRLTAAGVLTMTSNFKFNPKTNLNRGELAQITAALLSNL